MTEEKLNTFVLLATEYELTVSLDYDDIIEDLTQSRFRRNDVCVSVSSLCCRLNTKMCASTSSYKIIIGQCLQSMKTSLDLVCGALKR